MFKIILIALLFTIQAHSQIEKKVLQQKKNTEVVKHSMPLYSNDDIFISKENQFGFAVATQVLTGNIEVPSAGTKIDFSGYRSAALAQYGLTNYLNLFLSQAYSDYGSASTNGTASSYKGIGDTAVGAKGLLEISPGWLIEYESSYQASLLSKSEYDERDPSNSINTAGSTRPKITLEGTIIGQYEQFYFGSTLRLASSFSGSYDTINSTGTTTTTQSSSTANQIKIFAEYDFKLKLGLSYLVENADGYDSVKNNITTKNASIKANYIRVYGLLPIDNFQLVGAITKISIDSSASTVPLNYNVYLIEGGIRASF